MSIYSSLNQLRNPSRYCGLELNKAVKDWQAAELRVVLAFPDMYEIGMSHQGLQILYHILNGFDEYLADRVYAPDTDMENLLRTSGEPLFSVEHQKGLAEFDVIGITLPYELCYTNILTILDLAGIPLRAAERRETHPLVVGGGPCGFHPEPIADVFDIIVLGDGEEIIVEIAALLKRRKVEGWSRQEVLRQLTAVPGIYIPALFKPHYNQSGIFSGIEALQPGYEKVERRILSDLEDTDHLTHPLVPVTRIVHDRLGIEIARGCTRGCRFCQAGFIYRPVRERSPEKVLAAAASGIEHGGFEEIALLSLSTGDYTCIAEIIADLMNHYKSTHVSLSVPSMRVGTLTKDIMELIKTVRKTGFTLAPEAGSERLRQVINKGITEEDLLLTTRTAYELGWKLLKFYFMYGLPTETAEDIKAIPDLVKKAVAAIPDNRLKINVSASVFVPKPHTPFQWSGQLSIDESLRKLNCLRKEFTSKRFQLKWNDPRQSFLEGVFSRGDRRLFPVIETAWKIGARFDSWSEHFRLDLWEEAAKQQHIDLTDYLRSKPMDASLPWDHLKTGIDKAFLQKEYERAVATDYTPDCRRHGCQQCGLCDFKKIRPITHPAADLPVNRPAGPTSAAVNPSASFVYMIRYTKLGRAVFVGHLDLIQSFFRSFRRVDLPLRFSQGFHPSPKVASGPALSLGIESMDEYLLVDLFRPLPSPAKTLEQLNSQLIDGVRIHSITLFTGRIQSRVETSYRIIFEEKIAEERINDFLARDSICITNIRKNKVRKLDIRPLVIAMEYLNSHEIRFVLQSESGQAGAKPQDIIDQLVSPAKKQYPVRIIKEGMKDSS